MALNGADLAEKPATLRPINAPPHTCAIAAIRAVPTRAADFRRLRRRSRLGDFGLSAVDWATKMPVRRGGRGKRLA